MAVKKSRKKKPLKWSDGVYHARITLVLVPVAALLCSAAFFVPLDVSVVYYPSIRGEDVKRNPEHKWNILL
jgi:hypothetical protein